MKRKSRESAKEVAVRQLLGVLEDFLAEFPEEERQRRIKSFGKSTSASKKNRTAKSSRRAGVSPGPRRAAIHE